MKFLAHSKACPKQKKNALDSLLTLQTSPAHLSREPKMLHWGNHGGVVISFPSEHCLCVFLCSQIQRTLGSCCSL